ncbi:MAG: histidinol-phosphatase [Bacteroides sp.]|nr:histidinol-phosphatase [Bacteroides sp.]
MNIRDIIASTRDYNLHSHTQFCDGRAEMACFVEAALEAGMKHLGFTPHSPIPIESPCNMSMTEVGDYIAEFNRLKELYAGRINLYMSMEIDYLGETWGTSNNYFASIPLDYKLSSIHFIPTPDDGQLIDVDGSPTSFIEKMHKYFHDDIRYVVNTFYAHTLDMIEAGGFDMIGHFDKIGFNASHFCPGIECEGWYMSHLDNVIDAIISSGIVVEINTKAWNPPVGATETEVKTYVPRLFPSAHVIKRLQSAGVPLAVNSDVHYPDRITYGRSAAFEILQNQ